MDETGAAAALRFEDVVRLLPPRFRAALRGHAATPAPGMGGASVFRVSRPAGDCHYLKVACGPEAAALADEIARTAWLSSRGIRVPRFVLTATTGMVTAGLMTAVPGCQPAPGEHDGAAAVHAIGRGLARLHAVPAADCPFDEMPATRLRRARHDIDRGLIDAGGFDDRNASVTPAALYRRLAGAVPATAAADVVVVHGDATLANMLIGPDGELGLIDCGRAGRSDRYVDLAVVEMEVSAAFGRAAARGLATAYRLGAWDDRRAAFFRDLYELF